MKYLIIDEKSVGERLDKLATQKLGIPRNQVQKLIKSGAILLNDEKVSVHCFLNLKDKISISTLKPAEKIQAEEFIDNNLPSPEIVFKGKDYLVINKPAGWLTHPTGKKETQTLVSWLVAKFPEIAKLSDAEDLKRKSPLYRPGIIHRLDRDVSGLMLIPRNQKAFDYFKSLFHNREIHKKYLALVHGTPPKEHDIVEFEISRAASGKRMAAHPAGSGKGKPAATEYQLLKRFRTFSLMEASPLTGRTNQIRAHFQALRCPIVGDKVYSSRRQYESLPLARVFLHAAELEFVDQKGILQKYVSPLPQELADVLKTVK